MTPSTHNTTQLIDRFGREIKYLRISVTDRCDLRCVYCMSEDMQFVPRAQLLTLEEVIRIGRVFAGLGVSKIRITGGEPLTRRNIIEVFKQLGKLDEIKDLTLTTNATLLSKFAADLRHAGVNRINISLDTLQEERFSRITRTGKLHRTMAGIDAALDAGFDRIKLNAVILRNYNHDEVIDLVEFAHTRGMDISFIEEMPLGVIGDHDRAQAYISSDEILDILRQNHELIPTTDNSGGPARYYQRSDNGARVGFISPHSHNFCDTCNRVRLTAEGRLLLCLGQEHSVDLRRVVRAYPSDDAPLREAIVSSMDIKPRGHDFDLNSQTVILRHMNSTGG
ncbi:MAG: GTP 3',8-cyclase MoaA [Pseudomonadota bacterium]|nr:GTP 3',8-cyclase MoaA [Pseudomonadota bacterium]